MNFAYKRVSTEKQGLRRQEEAFKSIKLDKEYYDKISSPAALRTGRN